VVDIELWTSGTDKGYDSKHVWCSSKNILNMKEVNWKSGQPNSADGHCMFVQFSNKSANQTFVSMGDCSQKRKFVCQVCKLFKSVMYFIVIKTINKSLRRRTWQYQRATVCRQSACLCMV
jgi:hypothetical protein